MKNKVKKLSKELRDKDETHFILLDSEGETITSANGNDIVLMAEYVYFQTKNMNPKYCEVGIILENDKDYIYYLDEPCKILANEVKMINKEDILYDKKDRVYYFKKQNCRELR